MCTLVALAAFGIPGTASADEPDELTERHVQLDEEFVFPGSESRDAELTSDGTELLAGVYVAPPAELQPEPGERVVVSYTNATSVLEAPTASCTQTVTAGNPRKTNNQARASTTLSRSSGCSNHWSTTGQLDFRNLLGLWARGTTYSGSTLAPGGSVTISYGATCTGTRSTTWVNLGAMYYASLETTASSAQVTLSCTS